MKALVVTNDFPPRIGGINDYVGQIVRRFPPGQAVVFTSSYPGAAGYDERFPHPVIRWPHSVLLPTRSALSKVLDLVRAERPTVVLFGATVPLALMGPAVLRRLGVPYATCTHGLETGMARIPLGRAALRWIGERAALVTVVSAWTGSLLRPVMRPARMERLPAGVDVERFHPATASSAIRERHGLGTGPTVCCVSRLVKRKGQDQLVRALPRISRQFPGVRLLIVGAGPDGRRLRRLAKRHGVSGRVVMTGAAPYADLPAYFRAGDVFAMPCRTRLMGLDVEALGAVYLQASAVGRPNVAGDTGGVADAVQHGKTGLLVDGRDVGAVSDAIAELLGDRNLADRMGEEGAAWVRRELTWDLVSSRLQAMLDECGRRAQAVRA
ncbi:MAG: glycosyltransferase family 4 protein [Vicinamibacterales bacterium]